MRKIYLLMSLFLIITNLLLSSAQALDIEIQLQDYECIEDGRVQVHYGIINNREFDIANVVLGFKVLVDDKPVGCKEIKVDVPKVSDGSDIQEIFIEASCKPHTFKLGYAAFHLIKRYKIDNWFSGCP